MSENKKNLNNETFYVFLYETKEEIFSKLFNKNTEFHKARLNGYYAATDDLGFKLLKKDRLKYVDGYVYKITKDELFKLDRFLMFPLYGRFEINVITLDTNEILENVLTYSRLELAQPHEVKQDDASSDEVILKNIEGFNKFADLEKNEPFYDFILLWEITKEQNQLINENPFPFFNLDIKMKEQQDAEIRNYGILFTFEHEKKYYAAYTMFAKYSFLSAIDYYNIFYQVPNSFPATYNFIFLYDKYFEGKAKDYEFLNQIKPIFFISTRLDLDQKEPTIGVYQKACEFVVNDFNKDHFERYNWLLSAFFDAKNRKIIKDNDK